MPSFRLRFTAVAVVAAAVVAGLAYAQDGEIMQMGPGAMIETDLGYVLTGPDGMTLYTYDNDAPGVSNCDGGCAENWPPFFVGEGAMPGDGWSIVERADGAPMWAYQDQPVYYWVNDLEPGDTTGDGVGGVWHVIIVEMDE